MESNKHVQHDIDSGSLIGSRYIMLSRGDLDNDGNIDKNSLAHIGLIMGINIGDGRPVNVQGEMGSDFLVSLIGEGQQSMSFQRFIPINSNDSPEERSGKSALAELYPEIKGKGVLFYDLDEFDEYKKPIQLMLTIAVYSEGETRIIAEKWLKNAMVSSTSIGLQASSQVTPEPLTISWEDTIDIDVESTSSVPPTES